MEKGKSGVKDEKMKMEKGEGGGGLESSKRPRKLKAEGLCV